MNKELNIAVFGDLHGHLRLMLQLCRLWQRVHGVYLDGVIQCGDIGFFPDPGAVDKATRKFAEKDPEERGFARYFRSPHPIELDDIVETVVGELPTGFDQLCCPIICVNGNHEDFAALDSIGGGDSIVPLDYYEAFLWLRSGNLYDFGGMTIGGVGGGPETQTKKRHPLMYVQERDCMNLLGDRFNVLVSHAGPQGIGGETDAFGSIHLRDLVEISQPKYHFYAHHHAIAPSIIGKTRCFWLNDVAFESHCRSNIRKINAGCMGILNWTAGNNHQFNVIEESWFQDLNIYNWKDDPNGQ